MSDERLQDQASSRLFKYKAGHFHRKDDVIIQLNKQQITVIKLYVMELIKYSKWQHSAGHHLHFGCIVI